MSQRQKILIIIVGIIVLMGFLGLLVFFFGKKSASPPPGANTANSDISTIPSLTPENITASSSFTQITENPVPLAYYDQGILYSIDTNGALWKKDLSAPTTVQTQGVSSSTIAGEVIPPAPTNEAQRLGGFTVNNPNTLLVSPNGNTILIGEGTVNGQKTFSLVSQNGDPIVTLPQGVEEAAFLTNATLAYYKETISGAGIYTYTITDKKERLIRTLNPLDIHLYRIDDTTLLLAEKPTHGITTASFLLNMKTGVLSNYFSGFLGTSLSPLGNQRVLALTGDPIDANGNSSYHLSLLNKEGSVTHTLTIITMPEKCVADAQGIYLYCAIPLEWTSNMPDLSLPDDYYAQNAGFSETILRINLQTFFTENINQTPTLYDAVHLSLSADNTTLYFYDRRTNNEFSLLLPPPKI
ncbi:MAG: hypothetical protein KGI50_04230 [Patescibacteria group bacterium]|nr:hypothetical protein [Patescibacteria group bacterium]MDE2438506.1 hypothetical protein [Patescibacteria group bacterium]